MSALAFTFPEYHQTDSKLLQLPDEILSKILRSLLRSPVAVQVNEAKPLQNGTNQLENIDICLSSQSLRTCQQLLRLGHEVLYGENTLCVFSIQVAGMPGTSSSIFCCILDKVIELRPREGRRFFYKPDTIPHIRQPGWSRGSPTGSVSYIRALILQFSAVKFSMINGADLANTGLMFRWFRELNMPGDLRISLECDPQMSDDARKFHLNIASGWLRCSYITVDELSSNKATQIPRNRSGLNLVAKKMMRFEKIMKGWPAANGIYNWLLGLSSVIR